MTWPLVLLCCLCSFLVGAGVGKLMGHSEAVTMLGQLIETVNKAKEREEQK